MAETIEIPYKPMKHQQLLHDTEGYLMAVCGRQIGKTVSAVNEIIKRAVISPRSKNWYVTGNYKQAKRNVWDLFRHYCVKDIGAEFNTSELKITLPNQSIIELHGVENIDALRGAVLNFAVLDEYKDFPMRVFPEVIEPMFSTTNGNVWFLGTPGGMGNDFYLKWTEENDYKKFSFPSCEIKDDKVVNILSKYASKELIQKAYDTDHTPGKIVFAQEYLGQFTKPVGVVYSAWDINHFIDLEYDEKLPLHISFDFGVNDPTAILWIQPNGSETRVIDAYEASDANIEHFIQIINSKPYKPADLYTGDIAGKARELTTGTSPIDILANRKMFVRTAKIKNIQSQIRATHTKIPGLWVSKKASRFYECILNYRYPEINEKSRNQSNEIPIHDEYSHMMRAFEYWVMNYQPPSQRLEDTTKYGTGKHLIETIEAQKKLQSDIIRWR